MTCPNCGAIFDEGCRFCGACGTPLTINKEKKGTHRVPIIIMLVLSILGTCLFFATGGKLAAEPGDLPQMDFGFGEDFMVFDGMLSANPFNFDGVTEITVPETVDGQTITVIDELAFFDFDDVTVIHLPDTVEHIEKGAFDDCNSLRGMDLPPAVEHIGDEAFLNCTGLEAVHIPASVDHMGQDVFLGCDSLAFIFYDGTIDQWKDLYPQNLRGETTVCCVDGNFHQAD